MNPFDEMLVSKGGVRGPYEQYGKWFAAQDKTQLSDKTSDAEKVFRRTGITFAVYGDDQADERLIPFDIIPRIISGAEWRRLEQGIEQRVLAINAFLDDIYHRQEIIRAGRIPKELIYNNEAFLPEMIGFRPPGKSTRISSASILCAPPRTSSTFWKTMPARLPACPTCWKTARP